MRGLSLLLPTVSPKDIRAAMAAMPPTDVSASVLYAPVPDVLDAPAQAMTILRATYANQSARWPSKLHDIALLAAYFGDRDFALKVLGEDARYSTLRLMALWYPMISDIRSMPGFKELVTDLNLVEYWRANGWADWCRPLGEDDFECF